MSSRTDRECDELIVHAITIGTAALRETKPADQIPTDAERAKLASDLRAQFLPACKTLSPDSYRCALATKTLAELTGCHETPSSSTSNSSVAPGGIAPPAPRSP